MPDGQYIRVHGVQGHCRVDQGLTFFTELVPTDILSTSAPSRLPASSKLVRVRVEFSKKRLMIVRPRRRDIFFVSAAIYLDIAVGKIRSASMSGRDSPSMPSRCRSRSAGASLRGAGASLRGEG